MHPNATQLHPGRVPLPWARILVGLWTRHSSGGLGGGGGVP